VFALSRPKPSLLQLPQRASIRSSIPPGHRPPQAIQVDEKSSRRSALVGSPSTRTERRYVPISVAISAPAAMKNGPWVALRSPEECLRRARRLRPRGSCQLSSLKPHVRTLQCSRVPWQPCSVVEAVLFAVAGEPGEVDRHGGIHTVSSSDGIIISSRFRPVPPSSAPAPPPAGWLPPAPRPALHESLRSSVAVPRPARCLHAGSANRPDRRSRFH
jgi:hypothetical protein